jgi:hypothetical protein
MGRIRNPARRGRASRYGHPEVPDIFPDFGEVGHFVLPYGSTQLFTKTIQIVAPVSQVAIVAKVKVIRGSRRSSGAAPDVIFHIPVGHAHIGSGRRCRGGRRGGGGFTVVIILPISACMHFGGRKVFESRLGDL